MKVSILGIFFLMRKIKIFEAVVRMCLPLNIAYKYTSMPYAYKYTIMKPIHMQALGSNSQAVNGVVYMESEIKSLSVGSGYLKFGQCIEYFENVCPQK